MARYKNGINGPVSGKVGTVIGASWRGDPYLKGKHKKPGVSATAAQLAQRAVLSLANSWLRPVRELIWIGFQIFKGTKTPMNGAVSLLMRESMIVEDGLPKIDYPKVLLSRGELLVSWMLEVKMLDGAMLRIEWDNGLPSAFNRDEDKAIFIVYNPLKDRFVTFQHAAVRADRKVILPLPSGFIGDVVHVYMFYVNGIGDAVSTSQYLAAVLV